MELPLFAGLLWQLDSIPADAEMIEVCLISAEMVGADLSGAD